jgi:hypothetical protein
MKKRYLALVALLCVIILAIFTNPKQERHKEVLKAKLNAHLQQSAEDGGNGASVGWERAGQAFGIMLGGFIVEQAVNNLVSTDDYILFSTTRITWQGDTRTIGIGAFGNVFLSGKIDEALENGLLEGK